MIIFGPVDLERSGSVLVQNLLQDKVDDEYGSGSVGE